jgi:ribosomal protein L40E
VDLAVEVAGASKFCIKCKEPLPLDAKFCRTCGAPQAVELVDRTITPAIRVAEFMQDTSQSFAAKNLSASRRPEKSAISTTSVFDIEVYLILIKVGLIAGLVVAIIIVGYFVVRGVYRKTAQVVSSVSVPFTTNKSEPPTDNSPAKRIHFQRGEYSTSVANDYVGGLHKYVVKAGAGQTMDISIQTEAHTAIFSVKDLQTNQIITPSTSVQSFKGNLPTSGDYLISIYGQPTSPFRYTLNLSIHY